MSTVWFNGGPGCSSLIGLMTGNGPFSFDGNSTQLVQNPHSWTKLGHVLYIDQPAGAGFSTASTPNPVRDNERVTSDFYRWLQAFYTHFPHLQSKQLHMIGESYAGIYIPYFASAIAANNANFPLDLRSISLGDGTWGNAAVLSDVAIGTYLRSKQSLLQIPDDILVVFDEADQSCGFDEVIQKGTTYPPDGKFIVPGDPEDLNYRRNLPQRHKQRRRSLIADADPSICPQTHPTTPEEVLQSIQNSTCHGPCATFATAVEYLQTTTNCFDMYDVSNQCDAIDALPLLKSYFSRPDVQEALHVHNHSSTFDPCNSDILKTLLSEEPSPTPPGYSIIPDLTSTHGVHLHIYSGENDLLINHFGTEISMQNLTWRGTRGYGHKPDQAFYVDDAAPDDIPVCTPTSHLKQQPCIPHDEERATQAGIWGEGRRATYHLFWDAGHSVFIKQPGPMFAYVRDVVVSNL